jgi:hypothetical protein
MYCGPKCRKEHVGIHTYECQGHSRQLWHLIGIAHLGLRTFLVGFEKSLPKLNSKSYDTALQLFKAMEKVSERYHKSFQYGEVFRLVTNFDKMNPQDFLQYAMVGITKIKIIQSTFTSSF